HQFGVDLALALAQDVEDVFRDVAAGDQGVQLQEAGTALERVEAAEDRVEQVGIARAVLQIHQLFRQSFENFPGFHQEVLENLFVRIKAHSTLPCPATKYQRCRQPLEPETGQQVINFILP